MKRLIVVFLSTFLCMVGGPALSSAAQTFDVSMGNYFFSPSDLTINVGDTVRWTNPTGTLHTTTSGQGCSSSTSGAVWDSGTMSNGDSFSVTFDQPGTNPYHCTFHCGLGMTGTITVIAASTTIPLPQTAQTFTYSAVALPSLSTSPAEAQPIGIGDVATGGANLAISVALDQFEGPVDIYFLLYNQSIDPVNIYQLTSSGQLQTLAAGLAPWIPSSPGPINQTLFGTIPLSSLPPGTYLLGVAVMPAGDQSLAKFYLWVTDFTVVQ
ncbi:MAG: plastocyanin/azurin family copper-binding protein [Candidatus Sulfobium sp.]|jgi:plastocyanin